MAGEGMVIHHLRADSAFGHLDPEMRYTPGGQGVTSFSVASSRRTLTWWHGIIRSGEINGEE